MNLLQGRRHILVLVLVFLAVSGCIDTSLNVSVKGKDIKTDPDVVDAQGDLAAADLGVDAAHDEHSLQDLPDSEIPPGDVAEVEVLSTDWVEMSEVDMAVECESLCKGIECGYAGDSDQFVTFVQSDESNTLCISPDVADLVQACSDDNAFCGDEHEVVFV